MRKSVLVRGALEMYVGEFFFSDIIIFIGSIAHVHSDIGSFFLKCNNNIVRY